jgi:hypothetical protein
MKKIAITLTALAGITLSGCAYDYYGHYGYGYGPNAYYGQYGYGYGHDASYGHEAYGYAAPSVTTTTIYGTNQVPLSAGGVAEEAAAPQMSTGEEVATQMSTGEEAATQMSAGEEAKKTDQTAGNEQTP